MSEGRLAGRVAVITGGASGIGRACALRFAEEGADLVIADLDAVRGAQVVEEIQATVNGRAIFVAVDTADEESVEQLADTAMNTFGRIDTAVAAAGISRAGYVSGANTRSSETSESGDGQLIHMSVDSWQKVLDVNLTGVLLTDRAMARRMIAAGTGGSLVNVASSAARVALTGAGEYCVSKAGVVMLTQVLAMELVPYNIRVNAIGPGFIETPMTAAMSANEEARGRMLGMTPMGRLGTTLEMANAALYLACEESSYSTGQTLYPNGGMFVG